MPSCDKHKPAVSSAMDPAEEIGQGRGRRARLRIAAHATEKTQAVRRRPSTILGRVTTLGHVYKIPD